MSGKVSKTGDTMTGLLNLPANGLNVGSGQMAVTGGYVGIGTTSPQYGLHVAGDVDQGSGAIALDSAANATPNFIARKSLGTLTAPTAVLQNEWLGVFGAKGYGASQYGTYSDAVMGVRAEENFTNAAHGARLEFYTTPLGAIGQQERMRISASGSNT